MITPLGGPGNLLVRPPRRLPLWIRVVTWGAERKTGRELMVLRLLAWRRRVALSSAVLEGLISHGTGRADARLLQLLRIQVSLQTGCPFCIEMNSDHREDRGISDEQIDSLPVGDPIPDGLFSRHERAALTYARNLTATPVVVDDDLTRELQDLFNERELVVMATTIAQVDYWARLLRGLGVPVACPIPKGRR